jgi:urease accessory protein
MSRPISSLALLSCLLLPAAVMAHPGGEVHSFVAGAAHPLSGLDHLLAMLAVGLLAGCSAAKMRWWLPASFVIAMAAGAGLGVIGADFAFIEVGIAFSLIAFGAALVLKHSLRALTPIALTAFFALFHGHAHGTEMGTNVSAMSYAVGFMLATALLHAIGILLATKPLLPLPQATLLRWSGSAIAAVGVVSLGALLIVPA